ncbi:MAG TPA: hypothetical protein PKE66_06860 [Pyrinomonadaceae bacterium]|nr:hypothetical protein [Pyrinomonadaceae bacterium]
MKRRFAAIIFVLTIAGNIWAGVCNCVETGGDSVSSCCKREKVQGTAMSAQPCCEELCGDEGFVNVHRANADAQVKLPIAKLIAAEPFVPFIPVRIVQHSPPSGAERLIATPQLPRPPDLFIRHNSFLI